MRTFWASSSFRRSIKTVSRIRCSSQVKTSWEIAFFFAVKSEPIFFSCCKVRATFCCFFYCCKVKANFFCVFMLWSQSYFFFAVKSELGTCCAGVRKKVLKNSKNKNCPSLAWEEKRNCERKKPGKNQECNTGLNQPWHISHVSHESSQFKVIFCLTFVQIEIQTIWLGS